jgi:ATP-dependent helicase HrpB
MNLPPLPIDEVLPDVLAGLRGHGCLVLKAPAGAGKTTRVPPAVLDAGLSAGQILLVQPRRLAARAAAARLAAERGSSVGEEIGYQVRFDRQAGPSTRVLAVTDGILMRLLADDPFLEATDVVIFDEFHERSVYTDLALALVRRVRLDVRPELKIIVMSATLAAEPIARYLGDAPVVTSQGRMFPVALRYLPHSLSGPLAPHVARGVETLLAETTGDVLAFLPGMAEIRQTERELSDLAGRQDLRLLPLHGEMPLAEQQAVLMPGRQRKVVLATNVAETSVTIEGVTAVVDSGLVRLLRLDPATAIDRLETVRVSRSSAEQRSGRAGRTAPGVCLRLWTEREQGALADFQSPEIMRVDLAGPLLQLLNWGERDAPSFDWFEPPPASAIEQALRLLERLGAHDARGITSRGRELARLPVHPRLGRALGEGHARGAVGRVALACALLSERDPFRRQEGESQHTSDSDVLDRVALLEQFERSGRQSSGGQLDSAAARAVLRVRDHLLRAARQEFGKPARMPNDSEVDDSEADEAVLRSLWAAFPDRLARRRERGSPRAVMLGGRGVTLARQSAVRDAELFVCVDLAETGKSDSLVRQASAVDRQWLDGALSVSVDVQFDFDRERVVALRRKRYEDLVLEESPTSMPAGYDSALVLAEAAAERLERSLRLDDVGAAFLARVAFLRRAMPELELPDFGPEPLRELLPWLCMGRQSFDELRRAPIAPALRARLSPVQLQAVDREAPERIRVACGRSLALRYEPGQPPILAARIQELFGQGETPRVAAGRVPVLLHLLAPNMRPRQITSDLASFWKNVYPQARQELRRRYPKHAWPEQPV